MPYSDRWGITATKLDADTYSVQHPDVPQPVTVRVDQVYPTETINVAAALFRAIQTLFPMLPPLWDMRHQYAVCRWKIDGYAASAAAASGQTRTQLNTKRNRWLTERTRLESLMGTDA